MAGAVINSLRFELHDTGELPYRPKRQPCGGCDEIADADRRTPASKNCRILPERTTAALRQRQVTGESETIALMQKQRGSETVRSVLRSDPPGRPGRPVPAPADPRRDGRELRREDLRGDDDRRHRLPRQHLPHHLLQTLHDKRACFDAALDHCIEELRRRPPPLALRRRPAARGDPQATAAMLELLAAEPALAQLLSGDAVTVEPAWSSATALLSRAGGALGRDGGEPPSPHRPPARLRPRPGPDLQQDRRRQAPSACPRCCRKSSTWRRCRSAATRRRCEQARLAARRRATERRRRERQRQGPAPLAPAPRPPRPAPRAGRALPARAPARRRGPGHRRQGLRGDHGRRHPRRGRGRPGELLRALRRQTRLHAGRPRGSCSTTSRSTSGRLRRARPWSSGSGSAGGDARLVRRRPGGLALPPGRAGAVGPIFRAIFQDGLRALHQAARRRLRRLGADRSCRGRPASAVGAALARIYEEIAAATAPPSCPSLLPELPTSSWSRSSAKRPRGSEQRGQPLAPSLLSDCRGVGAAPRAQRACGSTPRTAPCPTGR